VPSKDFLLAGPAHAPPATARFPYTAGPNKALLGGVVADAGVVTAAVGVAACATGVLCAADAPAIALGAAGVTAGAGLITAGSMLVEQSINNIASNPNNSNSPNSDSSGGSSSSGSGGSVNNSDLMLHESAGGHTIARHVGKTDAELAARNIRHSSTFNDLAAAEKATGDKRLRRNPDQKSGRTRRRVPAKISNAQPWSGTTSGTLILAMGSTVLTPGQVECRPT
jgi:hypothetical protein